MNNEDFPAHEPSTLPEPTRPVYESAAVDRARMALNENDEGATVVPEAITGAIIGRRYKLLELIGEGGMGVVWMAEQRSPIRRVVAIKLIKAGMDSAAVVARFEAERQALAMMDHPNIARIFDGGTTDRGHPFFVMELVKGLPLTRYCDERKMALNERLDLFVQVCGAVQHAHQKGIIHRDLKPGNLLVTEHDGKPVPKVIDFGLVKALGGSSVLTDHTLHTSYGSVAGTPQYMAPEQVAINALDVDTRADIYALGVILYELLAGSTPHEARQLHQAAWEEVRRLIREVDPPRPSLRITQSKTLANLAATRHTEPARLPKLIAGDLDSIVMKSLEKDRHRRYGTASDLAADLQRHLAGEPVLAAPPTTAYRLRKFTRKHRVGLATATGILLVLIAGALISTWQAIRAGQAERLAQGKTIEAQNQKTEAQRQGLEALRQREIAVQASTKAEAESRTVQRQLADSYVQNGISAWAEHDPSLAALWFSQALKLDQGDPHREAMDRIRLGDSFRHCAWPSPTQSSGDEISNHDDRTVFTLSVDSRPNGDVYVVLADGRRIPVDRGTTNASSMGDIMLASSARSGRLWNLSTAKAVTPVFPAGSQPLLTLGIPEAKIAIIRSISGSQIWDVAKGVRLPFNDTGVSWRAFSDDGRWIAGDDGHNVLHVLNLKTLTDVGVPFRSQDWPTAISNNGRSILVENSEGWMVWDTTEGTAVGPRFKPETSEEVDKYQISPDGTKVVFETRGGRCRVFDARTGGELFSLVVPGGVRLSHDSRYVRAGPLQWDVQRILPINALKHKASSLISGDIGLSFDSAALSPDERTVAMYGQNLQFWNAESLLPIAPSSAQIECREAVFSPDGRDVVVGAYDGKIFRLEVREVGTGRLLCHSAALGSTDQYYQLGISPDGTRILFTPFTDDGSVVFCMVFSSQTLKPLLSRLDVGVRTVGGVPTFSPDGGAVLYGDLAWNATSGEPIPHPAPEWRSFATDRIFAPDRKSYIEGVYGVPQARIYSVESGTPITPPFPGGNRPMQLVDTLALTTTPGAVRIWDARTALPVVSALACGSQITVAKIIRGGTRVVSFSDDGLSEWSIAPSEFTPADTQAFAELLSGRRIDTAGGTVLLSEAELRTRFDSLLALRVSSPQLLTEYYAEYSPAAPVSDILPSYREAVTARLESAQTQEQKKALAREWAYAGALELKNRSYREAALLEEKSLMLDDTSIAAKDHLAHAYASQGRFAEALAIYQKYAGQSYKTELPWNQQSCQVGGDLADLREIWGNNDDPALKQLTVLFPDPNADPLSDAKTSATKAMDQFKAGHIGESHELLRRALRAGANASNDSDAGRALFSARSLIDPASTQPTDAFADDLSAAAWDAAKLPHLPLEKYAYALELARRSVSIYASPYNLDTLGAAQFRAGDYKGALDSLAHSEAIDFVAQENLASNLIFSAMAHQKLGQHDQARALLQKVIDLAKVPNALIDDDKSVFDEAAAMIDPASTQPATKPSSTH